MLDFYALRSHEVEYLFNVFEELNEQKSWNNYPNCLFSYALTNFLLESKNKVNLI